jgi:uncharacterized cupin superfamily protein
MSSTLQAGPAVPDAANAELEPWPLPQLDGPEGHGVVAGEPRISGRVLWRSDDGKTATGLWECTPGTIGGSFVFTETDYLLTGRMTCTLPDGGTFEAKAGDVLLWPEGTKTTWEVHETVRKLFSMTSDSGLPI